MNKDELRRDSKGTVLGNVYDKYATRNPIARKLLNGYFEALRSLLQPVEAPRILEVGCGEGHLAKILQAWYPQSLVVGIDLSPELFPRLEKSPAPEFLTQSAYQLGFRNHSFDLVIAAEVLEHLERPELALAEMQRVTRRHVVVSVPREPLWRALNLARFTYVAAWGNTPGHLQHWSGRAFADFIATRLRVRETRYPVPWTLIRAETIQSGR